MLGWQRYGLHIEKLSDGFKTQRYCMIDGEKMVQERKKKGRNLGLLFFFLEKANTTDLAINKETTMFLIQ